MQTIILTLQENIFDVHHLVDFPITVDNMTVANVSALYLVISCLLGKILLVSRIQTAFTRRKRSGYMRLGKMGFQRSVRAAKKSFWLSPCPENIIVHREVAFQCHTISLFSCSFQREKRSLISIETWESFVR